MSEGEAPELDERCPECGRKRRHRRHAPSLPGPQLPRWVFLCLGIIVGVFGALISSSIGAGKDAEGDPPAVVAVPSTEARDSGPTVANPANSDPGSTATSSVAPTLASLPTTTTTSTTTTTVATSTAPPTTPPGANVADTVTTTSTTTTTTTLAPATAASILPAVPGTGGAP